MTKTIPLGAPDRWDYVSFDAASNRVFVAASPTTRTSSMRTPGAVLGKLAGLNGAHGQAVAADGTIWADSGKTAQLTRPRSAEFYPGQRNTAGRHGCGCASLPIPPASCRVHGWRRQDRDADRYRNQARSTRPCRLAASRNSRPADKPGHFYVNIASTKEIAALDARSRPGDRALCRAWLRNRRMAWRWTRKPAACSRAA